MVERKTYQKNIRFDVSIKDEFQNVLDGRDKIKYPYEGDLIAHDILTGHEIVSVEDIYYLEKMCKQRCLIKWGKYHICARGGSFKNENARVKKPYIFRIDKVPLSVEGIKKICSECFNYGAVIEDKEFVKICFQNKLIKEDDGYVCIRGGPFNQYGSTERNPHKFKIDKRMMPLDIVRRICNGACDYSDMY